MSAAQYTVAIVVDPTFGEQVRALLERMPVWIVDSDTNRRVAKQIWAESYVADHTGPGGLTTFRAEPTKSPEEWCAAILWSVAGHHDAYSHDPGYSAIEVFGAELTSGLTHALAEFRLTEVRPFPGGFCASTAGGVLADSPNYPGAEAPIADGGTGPKVGPPAA